MVVFQNVTFTRPNETHLPIYHQFFPLGVAVLPTIIFVASLAVIGTFANIQVLAVYIVKYKLKSTYTIYVVCLAALDLMVCAIHMPCEILDLYFPYNFYNYYTCRLFRCHNAFLVLSSTFVLLVIAVDRYRHVCYPMRQQWTVSRAKRIILYCICIAFVLSLPSLAVFGELTLQVDYNITGKECFINDDMQGTVYPGLYLGLFYIIFTITSIIFIFTYSSIGIALRRQAKTRFLMSNGCISFSTVLPSVRATRLQTRGLRRSSTSENSETVSSVMYNSNGQVSFGKVCIDAGARLQVKDSRKTTKIAFFITILFIFTYLPYAALGIVLSTLEDFKKHLTTPQLALYRIAMRLCLLNSVCNCFIYSIFDQRFRVLCCEIYRDLFRVCKCKTLKYGCQTSPETKK